MTTIYTSNTLLKSIVLFKIMRRTNYPFLSLSIVGEAIELLSSLSLLDSAAQNCCNQSMLCGGVVSCWCYLHLFDGCRSSQFYYICFPLVGIVVNMLQHVVTACHSLPISGRHGWHANLVTEWVVVVTCHKLSCVVYNTTRWHSLLSVFVACCDATKKDVDVTSNLSCWRHVMKCHMLLTLSPSISLRRQTTIPTKCFPSSLQLSSKSKFFFISTCLVHLCSPHFCALLVLEFSSSQ